MKKTTLTILLALALIAGACITAAATATEPRDIQAWLSPDLTVKYNGEVQVMQDANGKEVYPILYEGTTYLPIRALCDMLSLPVNWVGETRTAELGATSAPPKSLLTATDAGVKTTTGNTSQWVKVLNRGELPGFDDFGGRAGIHSEAFKTDSCYMSQQTRTKYKLDGVYHELSFTVYNTSIYTARVQILDSATKAVLWSVNLDAGASMSVSEVNISISDEIEFVAEMLDVPVSARHQYNAVYICNPVVK